MILKIAIDIPARAVMKISSEIDLSPTNSYSWQNWGMRHWSKAFFRHFFEYNKEDTPVTRLIITDAIWSSMTGDTSTLPNKIRDAFLCKFPKERHELDLHLSRHAVGTPLHDFFPYLILTCLVAAASEECAEAGHFPMRLYELLGIQDYSPLPFEGLGRVWEELAEQLKEMRKEDHRVRELVLPDPGNERRIGYSKRLAFPSRSDQQELARLLNTLDRNKWLDDPDEPPVLSVLETIQPQLRDFSAAFREEFQDFKKQVSAGQETVVHPFWAAVLGVLRANPQGDQSNASYQKLDLRLLMEFDEFNEPVFSLLSKTLSPWNDITNQLLEPTISDYNYLLVDDENPGEPVYRLLRSELPRLNIRSSLLEVAQDGLLIFQRENGYRVARTRPPEPGSATVLVRQNLKKAFASALAPWVENRPLKPYPNSHWYWIDDLDGYEVLSCLKNHPVFSNVRCLKQIAHTAHITIYDGIRCKGGGYLSRFAALPKFRLEGGQQLRLNQLSTILTSTKILSLSQDKIGWRLLDSPEIHAGIDGEFEVVAENQNGKRIGTQRIRFQREVLVWNYGSPSDLARWEIETGQRDTVSLATTDHPLWEVSAAWEPGQCIRATTQLSINEIDPDWHHAGLGDLIEVLAAIGTTRTLGLAEIEFLNLLRRFLNIDEKDYCLTWDIARAWVETGFLQRISDRRWRSIRYLPQVPRLYVSQTVGGTWCGVVLGLAPIYLLNRLANTAKDRKIEAQWVASVSSWLPPGLALTTATAEVLRNFARHHGLDAVIASSLFDSLAPLEKALRSDDPPINYSCYATWDWERGRFHKVANGNLSMDNPGVFWYRREHGDQPDYFIARSDNKRMLWSYSRVWTLLAASRLLDRRIYAYQPTIGFVRQTAGGIYLPIVVGQLTFALSGNAPGPVRNEDGSVTYCYPLFDKAQVEWVGTQLLGWTLKNPEQQHIPDWLRTLALTRSSIEPSLRLSLGSGVGVNSVPVSLVPLYRHFISSPKGK
ncbi:hypothetical protein CCP3SC15_160020 [Gammaproteobacteria bacterium]